MKKMAREYFGEEEDWDLPGSDFKSIVEKSTHLNLSNLKHEFIHIADYDKVKPLKLLMKEYKKYARKHNTSCIVFCNSVQSARAMEHMLAEDNFKTASLHGEIPPKYRDINFRRFRDQEEGCRVLVATDLASRGIDIPAVSHIINFDSVEEEFYFLKLEALWILINLSMCDTDATRLILLSGYN